MTKNELLARFHTELRHEAQMFGFIREETEYVVRNLSESGGKGFILSSNVDEGNAREVIKTELNYFRSQNQSFEWKVYSYDTPSSLRHILADEGFTIDEPEALMVMKLDEQHPLLTQTQLTEVKEITTEQGIKDIVVFEDTIWNETHTGLGEKLWREKQNHPDCLYLYGIYQDEQLISAAWMYLEQNSSFSSLWGGSTLPSYRGKGYYTKLLAARAQKAFEKGHPFLTVDASPMSRPILEKLGFQFLAYSYGCQSPS